MKNIRIMAVQGSQAGFNIAELSSSVLLSAIAVTLAGMGGLISILSLSQASTQTIDTRQDASQALEFVVAEARQAQKFESTPGSVFSASSKVAALPGSKTPVVMIQLKNVVEPVVYFLAPANDPLWHGQALYRWGPDFDVRGDYDVSSSANPAGWEPALLVDQISQGSIAPSCNAGWSSIPTLPGDGFYSCIDSSQKITELVIRSASVDMELRSKVFARVR
ncbi:MAG: hypothetical protein AAGB01_08665 [Cyanobacteria bacterium P01_F01_bin.42]